MVSAVVDRGNGGPWEWRTPGMADLNQYHKSDVLPATLPNHLVRLTVIHVAEKFI